MKEKLSLPLCEESPMTLSEQAKFGEDLQSRERARCIEELRKAGYMLAALLLEEKKGS